jgi:RimJ/RimL family protein N-acetyltransferase
MIISFFPMDEQAAREIVRWRYEPPYDIYNLENSEAEIHYAIDPQNNFYTMRDENGTLVGFCSFGDDGQVPGGDYSANALDIGMGIRPDLTGKGHGASIAASTLDFARITFQPIAFRVTIAAFNTRARRVWEKNSFIQTQAFMHQGSKREFIVMMKNEKK